MKNPLLLFLLIVFSCQTDELTICEDACDNETVTEQLIDVQAKVIINNSYTNEAGESVNVYALTFNPDDLGSDTWTIDSAFILVPCNLPDRFKTSNLKVVISGNRTNCCDLLTQPYFRTSYGCRFEITEIRTN